MPTFNEPARIGDVLKREFDALHNREIVTIAEGQNLLLGTVVAITTPGLDAVSAAKAGGNTGNGTLTLDATTPVLPGAKQGIYTARCIAAAANSGTFRIEDPDGAVIGDVVVGATFSDDIKFVIADGAADFIVGDGFDITVSEGDAALYGAYTGTQPDVAVLLEPVDATEEDTPGCILARGPAVIASTALVWAGGVTDGQKAAALSKLSALGIVSRTGIGGAPVTLADA
jgi:hypothetical protein